jgi:hypothetical protein
MPAAAARIETDHPSRYLTQLCHHTAALALGEGGRTPRHRVQVEAEWTETYGVLDFGRWGKCTVEATDIALLLRVDAGAEQCLCRIEEIITAELIRLARRDDLTVAWRRISVPRTPPPHRGK